ncbi:MAG: HmuY family protein, partial [Bacteroidales bacterium]
MKQFRFLLMALAGILVFASCSKDEEEEQLPGGVKKYEYLDATSYTKWVYFSFKTGDTVTVSDPTSDLSWDIAFHRGDIRLNGGESGKGSGAAVNTELIDWDAVTEAPTSGYISDKTGTIITAFTGQGVEEAQQSFSQTLGTWLTIDTSNPPPKYTYHN